MQINQYLINKKANCNGYKPEIRVFTDCFDATQSVAIIFLLKVGGLYENKDNYGISHFLEHMAFKGTKNYDYRQIASRFDKLGGNFNAYTSRDRTVFFAKVLKEHAKDAIDLLHEIIFNSTLPDLEIEKERNVILQEIAQNVEAYEHYIFDMHYKNAYHDQPMGEDLLGSPEFINTVTRDKLKSYMDKFYRKDNILVSLSGNFDEKEIISYVEDKFMKDSYTSSRNFETNCNSTLPKSIYTPSFAHYHAPIEQDHMILSFEGVEYNSKYFYIQSIASMIFGEGMSSRLFQRVREEKGLAYTISSFIGSFHDTGVFGVYSASDPKDTYEIVQTIRQEISNFANSSLKDHSLEEELETAKMVVLSSVLMSLESNSARAEKVASNFLTFGRFISPDEIRDAINDVSVADIIEFFQKIILKSKPTFVSIGSSEKNDIYKALKPA